jgi:hypothetical protein
VAAEAALNRARDALAAGEPGFDPWRVTEARARYDAVLAAALDGVGVDAPEPRGPASRVPRMLRGRGGR